jgi:hypothetical protein
MHFFVLENRPQRFGAAKERVVVALELARQDGLLDKAIGRRDVFLYRLT